MAIRNGSGRMPVVDDFALGLAVGHGRRANAATEAAYEGAAELEKAAEYIRAYKVEIATLKRQAQIDEAAIMGRDAQIAALKAQHPTIPLFAQSGKQFQNGAPKTKLRLIFEQTFDTVLRKAGIVSPASFRED